MAHRALLKRASEEIYGLILMEQKSIIIWQKAVSIIGQWAFNQCIFVPPGNLAFLYNDQENSQMYGTLQQIVNNEMAVYVTGRIWNVKPMLNWMPVLPWNKF